MTSNKKDMSQAGGGMYQITIQGAVPAPWTDWFEGWEIASSQGPESRPVTRIKGVIVDQSELRGLLTRLWDLNAVVTGFHQVQENSNQNSSQNGDLDL